MIREKAPERAEDLLQRSLSRVSRELPGTWRLSIVDVTSPPATQLDAVAELTAPDGQCTLLAFEVKRNVVPRDVPLELERLNQRIREVEFESAIPTIVARYLSPSTREAISEQGGSYLDATGNARIQTERPPLFIAISGADRDPWRGPGRPRGGLRGVPAARVVRTLVDYRPPMTTPALADRSGTSVGATYRVVKFLEEEALLQREPRGPITTVLWRGILERWSKDYGFDRADLLRRFVAPRGIRRAIDDLRENPELTYVVTGSVAAQFDEPYADPKWLTAYVSNVDEVAKALGLRETDRGSNVALAINKDDFAFERSRTIDGLQVAAASQVAVDLMTGPGRSPAEAEALLDWMERNQDAWRR